jgi:tRNA threonylcarbamoyl adenosine modification protein YeaZ
VKPSPRPVKPSRSNNANLDGLVFRSLSFDTSTSEVHIALAVAGQIVCQEVVRANPEHGTPRQEAATILMPTIDRLVKSQAWGKADIDAIVVGSGPGSFTGIRTSVVTARALAQALGLPLISVSLLECLADQISERPDQVHGRPDQVHERPDQVHGRPDQVHGRPDQVGAVPDHGSAPPYRVSEPTAIILWATTGFYYLALIDADRDNTGGGAAPAESGVVPTGDGAAHGGAAPSHLHEVAEGEAALAEVSSSHRTHEVEEGEAVPKLFYVNDAQLLEALGSTASVYVDLLARAAVALPGKELRDLPSLENIAARQSLIAWNRVSLKISRLCEKLWSNIASNDSDEKQLRLQLRDEIRKQFPYEAVMPTYLRSPSVTVKKKNG